MTEKKSWMIRQSFDEDFVIFFKELFDKYGEEIFAVQGIANKNMDIARFSQLFFTKSSSVVDISVDENANVKEKNITQYNYENGKALMKLNSFYILYKEVKRNFGVKTAKEAVEKVLSGELFINDFTNFSMSYCYAFDLRQLLTCGMNFFNGNMKINPPKHSNSFISLLIQSTAYISNQIMGAASYPDFFVVLDKFYREEMGEDYIEKFYNANNSKEKIKILNQFQNFIYSMNFPFRGSQSLHGNERILINGNPIKIRQFVEDNLVDKQETAPVNGFWTYSLNRLTGKMEKKRIKGVIRHKTKDNSLIQYRTALGQSFVGTKGHALFTREGLDIKEITAETKADNLLVPINFCKTTKISTLDVPKIGGRLDINKLMLVPEIMYLIGQYIGNGSICICGSKLSIFTYNKEVNGKIASSMPFFKTNITKTGTIDVSIGKNVAALFKNLFGNGLHKKDIPRDLFDEEHILHLIGGYIDADSHARLDKGSLVISSVNKSLLESIQFILLGRGIVSKLGEYEREGFGKISTIYRLSIAAFDAVKLNPYLLAKKIPEKHRLDYSRQVFDFDGVYQEIMNKYNIHGLAENGIVPERSRDKSMRYVDIQRVVEWIDDIISKKDLFKDNISFMKATLSPKYRNRDYSTQTIIEKSSRITELKECASKLRVFLEAAPIRVEDLYEVEAEEYVYDISIEDNENFLTAANIYAHNSAFTNLSVMDMGFMEGLFSDYVFPDFTKPNLKSAMKLSQMFFEYFVDINGKEGIFTFPVMTLAISLDKNNEYIDPEFVSWSAKSNCEKAIGNIFQSEPNSFSSCCRLRNNFDQAAGVGFQNSFGVGGLSIGSHRVVGLNLPRISLLEKNDPNLFEKDLEIVHKILYSHRKLIDKRAKEGFLPLYPSGWISLRRQYSTIGFIGGFEYLKNKNIDIKAENGTACLIDKLSYIEKQIEKWQQEEVNTGAIYNVEQIPGENMCVKLCKIDTMLGYNPNEFELYSNQYIPLTEDASIYDRLRIQGNIDDLTSGGAILHLNIDDNTTLTSNQFEKIIRAAKESKTKYFAINYAYTEFEDGSFLVGKHSISPTGSKSVCYYTRVVGFITPVRSWNTKRKNWEFKNRVFYKNDRLEKDLK